MKLDLYQGRSPAHVRESEEWLWHFARVVVAVFVLCLACGEAFGQTPALTIQKQSGIETRLVVGSLPDKETGYWTTDVLPSIGNTIMVCDKSHKCRYTYPPELIAQIKALEKRVRALEKRAAPGIHIDIEEGWRRHCTIEHYTPEFKEFCLGTQPK